MAHQLGDIVSVAVENLNGHLELGIGGLESGADRVEHVFGDRGVGRDVGAGGQVILHLGGLLQVHQPLQLGMSAEDHGGSELSHREDRGAVQGTSMVHNGLGVRQAQHQVTRAGFFSADAQGGEHGHGAQGLVEGGEHGPHYERRRAMAQPRPTRPVDEAGLVDLKALDRGGLEAFVREALGEGEACALRIYKELWQRGVTHIAEMGELRRPLRKRLAQVATVSVLQSDRVLDSTDGTKKFLWRLADGYVIESVLIPDDDRLTLCMSSQVGCAMACTFCLTGDMGLVRHLTTSEIADQPLQVQRAIGSERRITNLVFMGMGEPLHNLPALLPALRTCLDDHGLNFSHRRVTVSTVGLVPKLAELAAALPVNLAVSLNATTEAQRAAIMPLTKRYSMAELLDACRAFPLPTGKRITFEYVMLGGFNDSLDDAGRLVGLLEGIPSKVNLIPYNENPRRSLRRPDEATVKAFQHHLVSRGMHCSVRTTRGIDISAACGQLGTAGGPLGAQDSRAL